MCKILRIIQSQKLLIFCLRCLDDVVFHAISSFWSIISYWSKLFSPVFVLVFTVIEINWMLKILGFFDYSCTSNYIGISLFTLKQRVSVCSISCSFSVSAPFSIRQIIRLNWNTIAAMIRKREKCKRKICWWPI